MTNVCMSVNLVGAFKSLSLSSLSSSSSSFVGGDCRPIYVSAKTKLSVSFPNKFPLTIEAAHKKGAGSTKNGRDSKGQRLGVKIFGDQLAKPGAIIIRQRGTKVHPGNNVGIGRDHTIFSLIDGFVKFEKHGLDKKKVSVYPREVPPMNPNSYRARKIEGFRLQRERRKARKEAIANLKLEARANFKQEARANFKPQLILASADVPTDENASC